MLLSRIFNVANILCFNAIRENKIIAKISEFLSKPIPVNIIAAGGPRMAQHSEGWLFSFVIFQGGGSRNL